VKKLIAVVPYAVVAQLSYLFWYLHYYRNPFRDEAYVHLLLAICAVAGVSTWRCLSSRESKANPSRFGILSLFRAVAPLAAAYIIVIVCFLSVTAAYATGPQGDIVEGFSLTADRLFSFGVVYFALTAILLVYALPLAAVVVIPLRELILRKRVVGEAFSLLRSIILPAVLYLALSPVVPFLLTACLVDSREPMPQWILSLFHFHPITWLESPDLSFWLLPFGAFLVGWSLLNLRIIRRYFKSTQESEETPQN
jgi:hypothetical protein